MVLQAFQVDAFTDKVFAGNPAAVVFLEEKLSDVLLGKIARENMLPETAFVLPMGNGKYSLRWFNPDIEIDLCGHATLAAAHVLFSWYKCKEQEIEFDTHSGPIKVRIEGDLYAMDFPLREPQKASLPEEIYDSLNIKPNEVLKARDYILVYSTQEEVELIEVSRSVFDEINIDPGGVAVTAPGTECDFVSRFFTPQATILEDPVTGSAHCSLAPYWSSKLDKKRLLARQLSERGGVIDCTVEDGTVVIRGKAVIYSKSEIYL
ncbi:MAG: PhzF family phenazine biosynthesis protein [Bacteroidales bacterium]|nr:PhzF family phenazine biosynthesis protein [Bacteroidales bacterium]